VLARPDSALTPFSGQALDAGAVTLSALDNYYALAAVVAPAPEVGTGPSGASRSPRPRRPATRPREAVTEATKERDAAAKALAKLEG
jgi:hypothetical protein